MKYLTINIRTSRKKTTKYPPLLQKVGVRLPGVQWICPIDSVSSDLLDQLLALGLDFDSIYLDDGDSQKILDVGARLISKELRSLRKRVTKQVDSLKLKLIDSGGKKDWDTVNCCRVQSCLAGQELERIKFRVENWGLQGKLSKVLLEESKIIVKALETLK